MSTIVTPLSYSGVVLILCYLLIASLPYLYDRTACSRLPDLPLIRSRCIAAMSYFVLLCLPSSFVLITHVSWGPVPPDLLTTYLSVLVIRTHHTSRSLLISYCTLVSTLRSISQPIPKPLTELGHLIVLYLYI